MSIHIIIDGYNLIRQSDRWRQLDRQDIQLGRERLVDSLVAYRKRRPHKITVVFDGTNAPAFSERRQRQKGIHVRFSAPGELADAVIKRMAARERERALVATSDRDVAEYAARCGAASISSEELEARLLMAEGVDGIGDPVEDPPERKPGGRKKGPSRKLSKAMRRKKRKLNKL